jgi:hypothetical protein
MSTNQNERHGDLFLEAPLRPQQSCIPQPPRPIRDNRIKRTSYALGFTLGIAIVVLAIVLTVIGGIKLIAAIWRAW